ncbi:MAG TPA: sigma factor-like helix-turn-helix DNA-binding protein [Ktedonobacterales bacterium]
MDERHGDSRSRRRTGAQSAISPRMPEMADVAGTDDARASGADLPDTTTGAPVALDPRDPHTMARLLKRTPSHGYEVADTSLVVAIRYWDAKNQPEASGILIQLLLDRCAPEFRRRAMGLRQRPDLMEDAIAAMIEQVIREARDPNEVFMTQNFIHYLKCLCIDNFNRILRQEGLSYKRDAQGRPVGRPQHIPRALIERIDVRLDDQDDPVGPGSAVADPSDALGSRMAAVEAQRILTYLPDPLDRQIMVLRALEGRQWEEIATICGKTERTMRLRFEKARTLLKECLRAEMAHHDSANGD